MADHVPAPLFMRDCLIKFGADSYQAAVESIRLTPSTNTVTLKTLSPNGSFSETDSPVWTLDMTYVQDWADATGLSRYLFDNVGDSVTLTFEPITGAATITATVSLAPGAIGGDVGAYGLTTVSLGVTGTPVIGA